MRGITWNCLLKSCYKKICIYELSCPCWISDSDARNPDEVVSNMPFPAFTYTCGMDKKIKKNNALMYLAKLSRFVHTYLYQNHESEFLFTLYGSWRKCKGGNLFLYWIIEYKSHSAVLIKSVYVSFLRVSILKIWVSKINQSDNLAEQMVNDVIIHKSYSKRGTQKEKQKHFLKKYST